MFSRVCVRLFQVVIDVGLWLLLILVLIFLCGADNG